MNHPNVQCTCLMLILPISTRSPNLNVKNQKSSGIIILPISPPLRLSICVGWNDVCTDISFWFFRYFSEFLCECYQACDRTHLYGLFETNKINKFLSIRKITYGWQHVLLGVFNIMQMHVGLILTLLYFSDELSLLKWSSRFLSQI